MTRIPQNRSRTALFAAAASFFLALPVAAQDGTPRPMASVPGGAVGSEVFISMAGGLTAGRSITLNFGGLSGYEIIGRADVPADAVLAMTAKVPEWAEVNAVYFFFLNLGGGVRVFSDPFIVTGPKGELEVKGTITKVEGSCVLMEGSDRTPYALADISLPPAVGAKVTIAGTLGILPGASSGPFPCVAHPGIPVRVATVRSP